MISGAHIIGTTGGSAGLAATYAAVRALADSFDTAGSALRCWAGLGVRTMTDPDLVESAVLSPATFAEAEAAVLAATTGPDGVLVASCGWEADAVLLRAVVAGFEATDLAVRASIDHLDRSIGRAVGLALGAAAPVVLPAIVAAVPRLPRSVTDDAQAWLVGHPEVVEHAVNAGGGLLEGAGAAHGVPVVAPDPESGARLLALAYGPDGSAEVHAVHHPVPGASTQPADLHGLLAHLRRVAALSPDPDSPLNGTLEVQTIGAGTDHVRHIVYLPGTDDLTTLPWTQDGDVRDFAGDLHALAGDRHAYQQGILAAMHRAGIGAHEPVLLVGHSLGGMEAAAILARGSDFDVTHVVTAGSPTAQVDGFPAGSHVLSLEHRGDVVPLLDGSPNPDSVQQTTVIFDAGDGRGGVVAQHEYPTYVAGAAAADASADPSVREQLDSLRAHGFLTGGDRPATPVSSQLFQVVRRS